MRETEGKKRNMSEIEITGRFAVAAHLHLIKSGFDSVTAILCKSINWRFLISQCVEHFSKGSVEMYVQYLIVSLLLTRVACETRDYLQDEEYQNLL